MKVAMVYSVPVDSIDGASKVVSSFIRNEKLYKNNNVFIDTYAPTGLKLFHKVNEGSPRKSIIKKIIAFLDITGEIRTAYGFFCRSEKIVKEFIKRENEYDVVFFHELDTCYQYIKRGGTKKIVLVLHTTGDFYSMLFSYYPLLKYTLFYHMFLKHVSRVIIRKADKIVFNSKIAANNFCKKYTKAGSGFATFVNNGIEDLDKASLISHYPSTPPYTIVCVGSITERKGQRFIVEALRECALETRKKVRFIIVGDGSIKNELEEECRKWSLNQYISFCGVQRDVVPFLSQSNIFILPSVDEGMPISILEAMRQGLPIVSTRVGGIPYQVVDGVNGLLIDASTKGVLGFLNSIEEYDWVGMGKESRKRYLEVFSMEQMVENYTKVLSEVYMK